MLILPRISWRPICVTSRLSMTMDPEAGSMIRNRPRDRDDLPAPVRPTMPTWNEKSESINEKNFFQLWNRQPDSWQYNVIRCDAFPSRTFNVSLWQVGVCMDGGIIPPHFNTSPCITTAMWRCHNPFSQWQRSFQWKLHSHWLKVLRQRHIAVLIQGSGGRFKNTYELLNLRALKFSPVNKIRLFQCMGKIFCVEFQRYPLKFHTTYLTHALKDMIFIQHWNFKSS